MRVWGKMISGSDFHPKQTQPYFVHASYSFCSISFCANLQSALSFVFFFFFFLFAVCFGPYPSTMPMKTRANRIPPTPSVSPSRSVLL